MSTATGNLSVEARARYAYIEERLRAQVPPPADVVELGSAPGDQIARLADLGYRTTSVDIGTAADAWGSGEEGRMRRLLAEHGVEDVLWDLEQTPYPLADASADAVVMTEVYEHLRDYPVRSLQEVRRILRPGGRLYFTTPNAAYLVNRLRALAGRSIATPLPDWIGGVPHARHAREYTFPEVAELMQYAGLRVLSAQSRHFYLGSGRVSPAARASKLLLSRIAEARPTLGPSIVVIAEPV
jgi:2-polyprenyl-6-hydroxyphenyl methylase/3-demethylubiquinone-9 3-methyltransferase